MNYQQYRPGGFRILPPLVKNLIIINALAYLAIFGLGKAFGIDLRDILGLHYFAAEKFAPYQFITYMFMHGDFMHILFNMFALWMFGSILENVWGPKRFLIYFLVTGIGAALVHYIVFYFEIHPTLSSINSFLKDPSLEKLDVFIANHKFHLHENSGDIWIQFQQFKNDVANLSLNPDNIQALQGTVFFMSEYKEYYLNLPNVIGASGAVFGILLAFGMLFPNSLIYIYFAIPIKAKWFVIIYGLIELYSGFANSPGDNVAHFAHLGGMIFGYFLIIYWKKR